MLKFEKNAQMIITVGVSYFNQLSFLNLSSEFYLFLY